MVLFLSFTQISSMDMDCKYVYLTECKWTSNSEKTSVCVMVFLHLVNELPPYTQQGGSSTIRIKPFNIRFRKSSASSNQPKHHWQIRKFGSSFRGSRRADSRNYHRSLHWKGGWLERWMKSQDWDCENIWSRVNSDGSIFQGSKKLFKMVA